MASPASEQNVNALSALQVELSQMAALVEAQLNNAILAFERRDLRLSEEVVLRDERIDELHLAIENMVMSILARSPLAATELRDVMSAMKVAGELERVGDLAKNIAKRTQIVSREGPLKPNAGVARMGRASLRQISEILDAYAERNLAAATAIWGGDDDLDQLYNSVFREIMIAMTNDSRQVNACTHLAFIAKNFERVGDHATNIAEAIHLQVTGSLFTQARPKGDETAATMVNSPRKE